MDTFYPEDEDETGLGSAQVDESGAFALSGVQAPTGGFSFVRPTFSSPRALSPRACADAHVRVQGQMQ